MDRGISENSVRVKYDNLDRRKKEKVFHMLMEMAYNINSLDNDIKNEYGIGWTAEYVIYYAKQMERILEKGVE